MGWKPGINPSYLYIGETHLGTFSFETWDIIFLYIGEAYWESLLRKLIGELLLKLIVFMASIEFSPLPSFTDWEYIHGLDIMIFTLFLPSHVASQLSFIKEQDVLMSDWEYVHWLDIFTLFLPSHATSLLPFIKERDVLSGIYHVLC